MPERPDRLDWLLGPGERYASVVKGKASTLPGQADLPTTTRTTGQPRRGQLDVSRGDLAAHVALLVATVAFFWPMIRPFGAHWYMAAGDFSRQFYPFRFFESEEWWHRRIPLWNPDMFAGHPFQADVQTAVFYPLAMANAILFGRHGFPYFALEGEVVVHTFLAGVFTFWLVRHLTGSRLGALVAGLAFAFGGFITSYPAEQLPLLETAIWLPLIVLFLELAVGDCSMRWRGRGYPHPLPLPPVRGGRGLVEASSLKTPLPRPARIAWPWLIAAGVAFGVAILAGHTQTDLFIVYATEGYLLWCLWRSRVELGRLLLAAVVYPLLAVGVSAVQILPSVEFLGSSTRDQMGYAQAAWGYLPSSLPEIFVPLWHGEKALSVGVVALTLAVIGAWASRREGAAYWTLIGLIAIPLSVGGATPLFWVLYHVAPGWDLFRDQERVIYIFSFAASVMAGRGVAELQRTDLKPPVVSRWARVAGVGAIVFAVLYLIAPSLQAPAPLRANFGLNAIVLAAAAAFLVVRARFEARYLVAIGLAILVTGELFAIDFGNNLSPVSPVPVPRLQRTADYVHKFPEPYRVRGISEAVFPSDYGSVLDMPTIGGDTPFQLLRMRDMLAADADWRVWQILNVKFFISDGGPLAGLKLVFQDGALKTYFMEDSLPRAWAVRAVEVAGDPAQARQMILAPGYHPGNIVVLEQPTSIGPFNPGPRPDVKITHLDPQRIEIDANAGANAMLVLAQQYYPDWRAYRDGQPVTTFRANFLAMAFELPPGRHHYVIVYQPWSFYGGAAISVLTLLGALGFVLERRARDRENSI
ncbi:MAG: YfhO family protein [Chloroflexota bacterium]